CAAGEYGLLDGVAPGLPWLSRAAGEYGLLDGVALASALA
ncbi:hypothetical protein A2U01_0080383, partial [Trifolium medium]|nr:hypothetical protein [Trifolium medium]